MKNSNDILLDNAHHIKALINKDKLIFISFMFNFIFLNTRIIH